MLATVTVNASKTGFCHIVQKEGWLRDGISWNKDNVSDLSELLSRDGMSWNKGNVSDLSDLLLWLCPLHGNVLSKDFLQDLWFQLERFVCWGEGLILCFSLRGSALISKINATSFLGTILWIWQRSCFFLCWNWIYNHRFRFTTCTAPLTAEEYLRPRRRIENLGVDIY